MVFIFILFSNITFHLYTLINDDRRKMDFIIEENNKSLEELKECTKHAQILNETILSLIESSKNSQSQHTPFQSSDHKPT